jgi:hypothetical protein
MYHPQTLQIPKALYIISTQSVNSGTSNMSLRAICSAQNKVPTLQIGIILDGIFVRAPGGAICIK